METEKREINKQNQEIEERRVVRTLDRTTNNTGVLDEDNREEEIR
jgi:hypothetical protein